MRKELSSFDVAAIVRELKSIVLDSRISNVYQLSPKTLLLRLHKANSPPLSLILEAGKRLHLTSYTSEKPLTPPAFCMALRKYLRDAWLTDIEQHEFERVVTITFNTKEDKMQLVLELFGDGNFILISKNNVILQALTYKRMRDRNILRGEDFVFAPSVGRNPFKTSKEELHENLKGFGDVEVVRAMARSLGIGGVYAEETLQRAGVDKTRHCDSLSIQEIDAIFDALQSLLLQITNSRPDSLIILDNTGGFADVVPFRLKRYEGFKNQPCSTFNEALDEFYTRLEAVEKATAGVEIDELRREAERLKRIIESQEKTVIEAEDNADRDKHIGDTIYAHSGELQVLLDRFSASKQAGKEWSLTVAETITEKKTGVKPASFFESFDSKSLLINVCVDNVKFSLALRKSTFENAAEFYRLNKQAKQKITGAKAALDESRKKLAETGAKIDKANAMETAKPTEAIEELAKHKVKHKEWFEKFRWFISSEGYLVVAGKDAVSNEVLIKKHTDKLDTVFHSDIVGAPFVVIKTKNIEPSELVIREAAEFAAVFSRGWREGFGSVDTYWIKPEQLSKKGPSGEYVPHGAFVVNGKRNWMRNILLRVAVGLISEENGKPKFVGGAIDAVKAKTKDYIVIVPGDLSGKELLKRVLSALARKMPKETRENVLKESIEQIREFIPYGTGRILED